MSTMQADELDIPATLGDAVAEHRSGDLAAAERLYRRILAAVALVLVALVTWVSVRGGSGWGASERSSS